MLYSGLASVLASAVSDQTNPAAVSATPNRRVLRVAHPVDSRNDRNADDQGLPNGAADLVLRARRER